MLGLAGGMSIIIIANLSLSAHPIIYRGSSGKYTGGVEQDEGSSQKSMSKIVVVSLAVWLHFDY